MISHKVIVIGGGPAGIGCMLSLQRAGIDDILVLEANEIGSSFQKWPKQMRLITPSFYGNPFFCTDLNAIDPETSPASYSQKEHISGREYADYLKAVVKYFSLNVNENEKVISINPENEKFIVATEKNEYSSENIIWAGGEFSNPKKGKFLGSNLCDHSSSFKDWNEYNEDEALIIGGFESAADAAYNLIKLGKKVTILCNNNPLNFKHLDPSEALSPYSKERLMQILDSSPNMLDLHDNSNVISVEKSTNSYIVKIATGEIFKSRSKPICATGFHSALMPIKELWEWENGVPKFTGDDQSTLYDGLYYSGPSLVHRNSKFCFIYKFRGRFGVISRSISNRIGHNFMNTKEEKHLGFLIDDLECCTKCDCSLDNKSIKFKSIS